MLNILLLAHDFGFPEGYAPTLRARLISRALTDAGAAVHVFCLRYSEIPPDILNTQASGVYHGVRFRYMNGSTTRPASFAGRRTADVRSVASTMRSILAVRRAGTLDAVYLWSAAINWTPLSQTMLSFLNAARIPVVLELDERPWNQSPHPSAIEKRLSPLHGISGAIVISDYLENWAAEEARRLGRDIKVIRVPILVDTDEAQQTPAPPPRERPFVMFACPPERTELFRFVAEAMRTVWREGIASDLVITGVSVQDELNRWVTETVAGPDVAQAQGSIDWLGIVSRDTLLGLYRRASALLLPLADELNSRARFPTKLGEYLSSGTPVVASARGELLAYLKDGESVFLAREGGAESFGQRIADVYRDAATAAEVGKNGREVAVAEFDYRRFGAELYRWFQEVITR